MELYLETFSVPQMVRDIAAVVQPRDGTALDLARDAALAKTADVGSLIVAVELAIELARRAAGAR